MPRFFNTTGPCDLHRHYMLPAEARLPQLSRLIAQEQYFVLHAPRQTGKTTAMLTFAARLRSEGVAAVWATLEESQGIDELAHAEALWIGALQRAAHHQLTPKQQPPQMDPTQGGAPGSRLHSFLEAWCAALPGPLVLLLDEADVVRGQPLVSLLRQLRAGFPMRGAGRFPSSVALIGMRDLRDYLTAAKDGQPLNPGSPFNVKSESLTLRTFTEMETRALYAQHSAETGQPFTEQALGQLYHYSQGQPFLVNALARRLVQDIAPPPEPIALHHVEQAKEELILSRTTHLDALAERLKEPRVAQIMAAVMGGKPDFEIDLNSDDMAYCEDLGLLRRRPRVEPANPLYKEVLGRVLSQMVQPPLPDRPWIKAGKLDLPFLIDGFLTFWRRHAEALRNKDLGAYREIVPHLVFMAWLQRIVNGGGRITREYALGRGALDLLIEYGGESHAIEIKRVTEHDSWETIEEEGLDQLGRYLDSLGLPEGWLLLFDERPNRTWEQRLIRGEVRHEGRLIHLRGA
jgi:AAA-like domain